MQNAKWQNVYSAQYVVPCILNAHMYLSQSVILQSSFSAFTYRTVSLGSLFTHQNTMLPLTVEFIPCECSSWLSTSPSM